MDYDLNNLIGLDELMELKHSISPKKYYGRKSVKLIEVKNPEQSPSSLQDGVASRPLEGTPLVFKSVSSLIKHVKLNTGEGVSYQTINKFVESGEVFKDRWIVKYLDDYSTSRGDLTNEIIHYAERSVNSLSIKDINSVSIICEERSYKKENSRPSNANDNRGVNIYVEITDIRNNAKLIFKSLKEATKHIKKETGKGTPEGLKYALDKGTAYFNIYLVKELNESVKLTDFKTNEFKYFSA